MRLEGGELVAQLGIDRIGHMIDVVVFIQFHGILNAQHLIAVRLLGAEIGAIDRRIAVFRELGSAGTIVAGKGELQNGAGLGVGLGGIGIEVAKVIGGDHFLFSAVGQGDAFFLDGAHNV